MSLSIYTSSIFFCLKVYIIQMEQFGDTWYRFQNTKCKGKSLFLNLVITTDKSTIYSSTSTACI